MTPDARSEEWERSYWMWELYFAVGYVLVLAMVATAGTATTTGRVTSAVALTLLVPWYLVLGRQVIFAEDHGWRAWVFVAGIVGLFCVAVAVVPMSAFALFAVYPLVFLSLPLPQAAPVVTVLSLAPVGFAGFSGGSKRLLDQLPTSLLCLAFALLAGTYIERIVRQSAERARLIAELEASRAEVGRLSHEAGVAAERGRLAAEIHDTLAQGFTSVITLVQAAEADIGRDDDRVRRRLDLVARTARDNLAEARALVDALAPSALGPGWTTGTDSDSDRGTGTDTDSDIGTGTAAGGPANGSGYGAGAVDQAIGRLARRTGEELGVPAVLCTDGKPRPLPRAVEVVLLRAAQEALANVRKHAGAGSVTVRLSYPDGSVRLLVSDDGGGFDVTRPAGGFGLPGMRKRAEQVGGTVTVRSTPGCGTEIGLEVPL